MEATSDIKLFKKWSYEDVNIADLSLVRIKKNYIYK